jgi:hypothetical protein
MTALLRTPRAALMIPFYLATAAMLQRCGGRQPAQVEHPLVFETSVAPQPDEDLADACRYELTVTNGARRVEGIWVIFERSRDMLRYYQDADVRAFARRHHLALLFAFHCRSKSETGGDINVDPSKGIGRALFSALAEFAEISNRPELASVKLILLGFSGTGSLVARLADFAPDRVGAVISTNPGHFEPLGMDTISLSPKAALIPQLILAGSADAVSGTQRPYSYFQRHFDRGAPWTFVVQNRVPHCCVMNAKALILDWLDAIVIQRATRNAGRYGFIRTTATDVTDCPGQSPPVRPSWCRSKKDAWGGENWSVVIVAVRHRQSPPEGMLLAGWLPTDTFARRWARFVKQREHPVTLPP